MGTNPLITTTALHSICVTEVWPNPLCIMGYNEEKECSSIVHFFYDAIMDIKSAVTEI